MKVMMMMMAGIHMCHFAPTTHTYLYTSFDGARPTFAGQSHLFVL